jgi:hypothetical protein
MAGKGANYCIIGLNKGPVVVKLIMDHHILCGAEFKLFDETRNNVLETWKMSANAGEFDASQLSTWPKNLNKCHMAWTVLCCSDDSQIHAGIIRIEMKQMDHQCGLSYPLEYKLANIPPCSVNASENFSGSFMFIVKK